ncbi:MAG: hypothetical protein QW524_02475 [Candidatus Woesearchaeota archaeon]
MGFEGLASSLIMFIAVLTMSVAILGVFNAYVQDSASALTIKKNQIIDRIDTEFKIVEVNYNASLNIFEVYVLNTGKNSLKTENLLVFLDGSFVKRTDYEMTILEDTNFINPNLWDKNELLLINFTVIPDENIRHEIKLVYSNGAFDSYTFN